MQLCAQKTKLQNLGPRPLPTSGNGVHQSGGGIVVDSRLNCLSAVSTVWVLLSSNNVDCTFALKGLQWATSADLQVASVQVADTVCKMHLPVHWWAC